MKHKKLWIAICVLIFSVGIIGSLYLIFRPHSQTVNIIQDGKTLYINCLQQAENQTIEVDYQGQKKYYLHRKS